MTSARLWTVVVVIGALLLLSLAISGTRLSWHVQGHTSILPQELAAPSVDQGADPPRDINATLALSPFGQAVSIAETATPAVTVSQLRVALRGVLVDPDPSQSRAFILSDAATATFRIGDEVQATELVAINADTITLKSGAGLVIVGFGGVQNGTAEPTSAADSVQENPTDPFARLAAAIVPGQGSIDLREAPPAETTDEYINLWRDRITQNPQAAMDAVGVELVENGYRIKADPNIGVTLAGLRPGDVVTRLNGQAVGDLDSDRALYDDVAVSGIARLEVVRDGQALLLTFPLR